MKALIVDDEDIIREGLRSHIDWAAAGFDEWAEAGNAVEAMERIDRDPPELVITDIFMPEMSGLDFAKKVRDKHPQIRFIILTGYEKFEYAKEAVEIGVLKYLVKPIFPDELRQVVEEARDDILNERKVQHLNESARLRLNQYKPVIVDKFWNDLLTGAMTEKQFRERVEGAELKLPQGEIGCAAVKIADLREAEARFGHTNDSLIKFVIRNVVEELLGPALAYVADYSETILLLVLHGNLASAQLDAVERAFREVLKLDICLGVSKTYPALSHAHAAANEALEAVRYLQMLDQTGAMRFDDIPAWKKDYVAYPYPEEKEIIEALRYRDSIGEEAMSSFLRKLLDQNASPQIIQLMLVQLIGSVYRLVDEYGIDTVPPYNRQVARLQALESLNQIVQFFMELFRAFLEYKNRNHSNFVEQLVEQAKSVVQSEFADSELAVALIAKKLCITPNYLSRIFHQKTGLTCVEYMTECRLQEAKKLLAQTALKNYEVAEAVGYVNSHYFSTMFKKNTGMSPSEYRAGNGGTAR